ncbi:hypothetical protein C5167_042204 [Papaver somniferum]|uniref:Uncharacterized protein n=1 Tax=Papaver somniferum TaxID=3469 RepID=A0A4Y7L5S7_PAPSO|nr:hypothetical protein C5167_042204 [Papaver somniferum]
MALVQKLGLDPAKETTLQGLNSALVELPSSERRARFQEYLILRRQLQYQCSRVPKEIIVEVLSSLASAVDICILC